MAANDVRSCSMVAYPYSGIRIGKDYSAIGLGAHNWRSMSEFSELFKRLLADRSTSSFAKETRTSQPAVYRAVHGGSIVVAHLEKWADGLGLTGDSRRQFIEAGKAEKAVKYKHSGPLARDAYARMERQNALLSRLIVVLLKDPHKLSQEARTLLEQLKEAL